MTLVVMLYLATAGMPANVCWPYGAYGNDQTYAPENPICGESIQ